MVGIVAGRVLKILVVAFGARMAQEKLGVPLAIVHLQPAILRSLYDAPGLPLPDGSNPLLRSLWRLLWASVDYVADWIVTPEVNSFRAELGLRPACRPFAGWIHSPDLVLGMFPGWFAPPLADWPPHTHLVGFPLFDEGGVLEIPAEVESFLTDGNPPIVFTVGSFARRSRWTCLKPSDCAYRKSNLKTEAALRGLCRCEGLQGL